MFTGLTARFREDELTRKMMQLVVPIAIQQFMLALVSATDAIMLGFVNQASSRAWYSA